MTPLLYQKKPYAFVHNSLQPGQDASLAVEDRFGRLVSSWLTAADHAAVFPGIVPYIDDNIPRFPIRLLSPDAEVRHPNGRPLEPLMALYLRNGPILQHCMEVRKQGASDLLTPGMWV